LNEDFIDLLRSLLKEEARFSGVVFDEAWARRASFRFSDLSVPVLGRDDLILNKRAAGRPKDLADLAVLDGLSSP
jgi:hypothetical protein